MFPLQQNQAVWHTRATNSLGSSPQAWPAHMRGSARLLAQLERGRACLRLYPSSRPLAGSPGSSNACNPHVNKRLRGLIHKVGLAFDSQGRSLVVFNKSHKTESETQARAHPKLAPPFLLVLQPCASRTFDT
jgi:hypothetical protein